jgi:hypothetical protein
MKLTKKIGRSNCVSFSIGGLDGAPDNQRLRDEVGLEICGLSVAVAQVYAMLNDIKRSLSPKTGSERALLLREHLKTSEKSLALD